jgi:hypothetical protein
MHPTSRRRRPTALVATLGCLAGVAAALAPAAHADPLTVATYQLKAADGSTLAQADCLADQTAAQTTFCQALIGRYDGTRPAQPGSQTLQWLRDARAAGAATVVLTEAGDGFAGHTTYTVPADDTSPYQETTVGSYPPATRIKTSRYQIASIDALAAEIDCVTGRNQTQITPGSYCIVDSVRPLPSSAASEASARRSHRGARRRHGRAKHR